MLLSFLPRLLTLSQIFTPGCLLPEMAVAAYHFSVVGTAMTATEKQVSQHSIFFFGSFTHFAMPPLILLIIATLARRLLGRKKT